MKKIVKFRHYYYIFFALLGVLAAFEIFLSLEIKFENGEFRSKSAAADINVISKEHHSIQHPKERKVVRDYLFYRLVQMGGSAQIFDYYSIKCKFGGTYDISNIYAQFDPYDVTDSTQYVMMIAHYDSRFFNLVKKDTVYSYGAADDGYGLAVILECVNVALKYRDRWKQGIKVLFTDSEEHELDGMQNAFTYDRHLFENVNFAINVEARGVKGPALMFEMSSPNENLIKIYENARKPYTYSLTTQVYKAMSNDTDFSVIKDHIPGLNFAVLDNLHYYHTDKDNYSNISIVSLDHYGMQIEPILYRYLNDKEYSDSNAFKGEKDNIFFTLPLLGLFNFSPCQYIILNIIAFVFFVMAILSIFCKILPFCRNRYAAKKLILGSIFSLLFVIGSFIVGEAAGWITAKCNGLEFNPVAVKYAEYDDAVFIVSFILLFISIWYFIRKARGKSNVDNENINILSILGGNLVILFVFSLAGYILFRENFVFLIPLLLVSITITIGSIKFFRFMYFLSAFVITLLMVSFIYILYVTVTIGALGAILMIAALLIISLVTCYYCYERNLL